MAQRSISWVFALCALSSAQDVTSSVKGRVTYEGAQLLRVELHSKEVNEQLLKLEGTGLIDVWTGSTLNVPTADILVKPDQQSHVKEFFRSHNITYKVAIENVQSLIDKENPDGYKLDPVVEISSEV